jgi:SET domain-containing protein
MLYKPLPDCLTIKESPIKGLGMFATKDIKKDTDFGMSHIILDNGEDIRTPLGGFFNHSDEPNCMIIKIGNRYHIKTIKDVIDGDELTLNYGRWYCGEPCPECFEKKKDKS